MQKLILLFGLILIINGCSNCSDCEPFAEEPFIKIRFYKIADSTANKVVIDSINHVWAGNFEYFQDTVNTYQLPLNMNEDISKFILSYRYVTDYTSSYSNSMEVNYHRTFLKRTNNTIIVKSDIISVSSDFSNTPNLLCADSLTCNSNEAIYQIYR